MGFSAMWEGQKRPRTYFLPDYPLFKKDIHSDAAVCGDLHRLLSMASHIVAHNGDSFDLKIINSRLLINGYPPPRTPTGSVDTLKATRRIFKMDSNRLDALGQATAIGRKIPNTGKDLWRACYHGDRKAFKVMARYCRQDTALLAKYHARIEPWLDVKFSGKLGKRQHAAAMAKAA